jgi:hypothetical protein
MTRRLRPPARAVRLVSIFVVFSLCGAAPVAANCADDWDSQSIRLTGQLGDIAEGPSGWSMETQLHAGTDCVIAELYGEIEIPPACRPGRQFEVLGFFEYRDDDHHFELWQDDLLALHVARINCL